MLRKLHNLVNRIQDWLTGDLVYVIHRSGRVTLASLTKKRSGTWVLTEWDEVKVTANQDFTSTHPDVKSWFYR